MEEQQFSGLKDAPVSVWGSRMEEKRKPDIAAEPGFSSDAANMDRYDYINMLAEARIVDMAWIR